MIMDRIVDFHSHILPALDDGSRSVEESIAMLRVETEQGIFHVVATPHFYARHDNLEDFLERRRKSECRLRAAMEDQRDLPQITVGAEIHYFRGISESDVVRRLSIGDGEYALIEMPGAPWTDVMYRELELIHHNQGITPIVAHVDRYLTRFRSFGIPERLEAMPVLVQANASFFLGSGAARAMRMIRKGQIHLLGSDCHNMHDRKPNLGSAVERIRRQTGDEILERVISIQKDVLDCR